MQFVRKILTAFVVFVMLSATASFAVADSTAPNASDATQDDDLVTVRVGLVPVLIYSPLFIAEVKGYFADEGIQIEVLNVAGGSEPLAPLARGELDVVFGGAGAGLFNYAARNIDIEDDPQFRIITNAHTENPPLSTPIVVSAERFESGELTSIADLEGGRVSINAAGAATEWWLVKALEQGGLTTDDIELVAVGFPDVAAALNSEAEDRIDAAMLGEPVAAAAEAQGLVVRLSDDFLENFQSTFVYASNEFVTDNRDVALGFTRALLRAYRDLQNTDTWSEPEVVEYLSEATFGYSEDLLDFYAFPYFPANGEINVEDLETLQGYYLGQGQLAYEDLLDVNELIDFTIVEDALEEIGMYEEDDE